MIAAYITITVAVLGVAALLFFFFAPERKFETELPENDDAD